MCSWSCPSTSIAEQLPCYPSYAWAYRFKWLLDYILLQMSHNVVESDPTSTMDIRTFFWQIQLKSQVDSCGTVRPRKYAYLGEFEYSFNQEIEMQFPDSTTIFLTYGMWPLEGDEQRRYFSSWDT